MPNYLLESGADHPGKEEIIQTLPGEMQRIKKTFLFNNVEKEVFFIKGMAHHYLNLNLDFLKTW